MYLEYSISVDTFRKQKEFGKKKKKKKKKGGGGGGGGKEGKKRKHEPGVGINFNILVTYTLEFVLVKSLLNKDNKGKSTLTKLRSKEKYSC